MPRSGSRLKALLPGERRGVVGAAFLPRCVVLPSTNAVIAPEGAPTRMVARYPFATPVLLE